MSMNIYMDKALMRYANLNRDKEEFAGWTHL